jgi:hypothetical protein
LKRKREALLAQLNEFKEADGGDKQSKRRTKAQRKDTVKYVARVSCVVCVSFVCGTNLHCAHRLFEQLQGELDEVEAALAQHQTLAPAKLKRKEAAPEKTLSATQDLMKYPHTLALTSPNLASADVSIHCPLPNSRASPQPARSKTFTGGDSRSVTPIKGEPPAAGVAPQEQYGSNGATPVPGIVVTNSDNDASTSTSPTSSTTSAPTSPQLSHSSEKELKQRKREEKKAEKLKKKEEKKRKKEEKKAEKQRLREEKKLSSSSGGGRARRGTIATASPSRDGIDISITRTAVGSATNGAAGVSHSGSTPTKLRADDDELESGAKSPEKGASAEAEAKGRHDKGASAEVASKKAADAKSLAPSEGNGDDGGGEFYSYEELKKMKDKLDRTKLEVYLLTSRMLCVVCVVCCVLTS